MSGVDSGLFANILPVYIPLHLCSTLTVSANRNTLTLCDITARLHPAALLSDCKLVPEIPSFFIPHILLSCQNLLHTLPIMQLFLWQLGAKQETFFAVRAVFSSLFYIGSKRFVHCSCTKERSERLELNIAIMFWPKLSISRVIWLDLLLCNIRGVEYNLTNWR